MKTRNFITPLLVTLPITTLIFSCGTGNRINTRIDYLSSWYTAWNEYSTNSYKLIRLKDNRFVYEVLRTDSSKKTSRSIYQGKYRETFDTIHLKFDKQPDNWASYVLSEASGTYVIQKFSDSMKSVFMRTFRRPFR